jgi:hypothetical protein
MDRRSFALVAFFALVPLPAAADPGGITVLPPAPGQRIHFHVVRTVQGTNGPLSTTTAFDVVRRAGTTLVIERPQPDGAPNISVLTVKKDGSIALAEDARGAAADADLGDLLAGLNLALLATRLADASGHAAWATNIPVSQSANAASALVTILPTNVAGRDFDFTGDGQATDTPPAERRGGGGLGFPGGGSGFPGGGGGGYPHRSRGGEGGRGAESGAPTLVNVHIEGHVSRAHVERITIAETRSITVGNLPFVNVGSWAISTAN